MSPGVRAHVVLHRSDSARYAASACSGVRIECTRMGRLGVCGWRRAGGVSGQGSGRRATRLEPDWSRVHCLTLQRIRAHCGIGGQGSESSVRAWTFSCMQLEERQQCQGVSVRFSMHQWLRSGTCMSQFWCVLTINSIVRKCIVRDIKKIRTV